MATFNKGIKLTNKTIVVTGGGRGIGVQFCEQLIQKGNTVIATVRGEPKIKVDGVTYTQLDVTKPDSINKWASDVAAITGHIDVLLNNAGLLTRSGFSEVTAEEMMEVFSINSIGPLLVAQALYKRNLLGGKAGSLIANVTSKVGSVDDNGSGGIYAYRASKSALNIISKSMSIDLADDNITTTLLHPGWVKTEMTRNNGLIDAKTSAAGMLAVLESGVDLQGTWHDYASKPIAW